MNMKYKIFSDDVFLHAGLIELLSASKDSEVYSYNLNSLTLSDVKDDILLSYPTHSQCLIVYVSRYYYSEIAELIYLCNIKNIELVVFLDIPRGIKPCSIGNCKFISTKQPLNKITSLLASTRDKKRSPCRTLVNSAPVQQRDILIFSLIYNGVTMRDLSEIFCLPQKKIYKIKRTLLSEAFLENMNALGIYLFYHIWMMTGLYHEKSV